MTTRQDKAKKAGGSKKKQSQKLKNVLAYPFPQYWPELNAEQTEELKNTILTAKKDFDGQFTINADEEFPIIGLSNLLRNINREAETYFLLSTEIKPRYIASQIINLTLSKFKTCRVLCVPSLKELTKSVFGIETLALGYRSPQCQPVEDWIAETQAKYFPVPEEIRFYYAQTLNCTTKSTNLKVKSIPAKKKETPDVSHLHLERDSVNQRAFMPRCIDGSKPLDFTDLNPEPAEWSDFISLSVKPKTKSERMDLDSEDSGDFEMEKMKLANTLKKFMSKENNGNLEDQQFKDEKPNGKRRLDDGPKDQKKNGKSDSRVNYIGLTVNRIQPNPEKLKKKKKKNK